MLCDHAGDAFIGSLSIFNVIGRIAFPIFAFQLAVGYKHTKNIKKYFTRLISFAFISQIPFTILLYIANRSNLNLFDYLFSNIVSSLNIFFTLSLGLLVLFIFENVNNNFIKCLSIALVLVIAQCAHVDYGAWGVFLIFFIYLFCPTVNDNKHGALDNTTFILGYLALCIVKYLPSFGVSPAQWLIPILLFTFLPFIFMLLYNGKKGPSLKYFFYTFYPLHLIILDLIYLL